MSDCHFRRQRQAAPRADMNVVPLVDVMLVLLVIFIVTAPLLTHAVKIDLPQASSQVNVTRDERVELAVREDGTLYWNGEPLTLAQFAERCDVAGRQAPQPELHLHADRHVHWERVAQVLAIAVRSGLQRVGFVSLPEEQATP